MMHTTSDTKPAELPLLERFARALAHIVHEERPEALARSVTVAELYQDIAPYRRMRELAGIEMHADYEHALIRFLSGEGGFARLDPETAADELGIEAESSDPDLSLYRKFAACDVRLALGAMPAPVAREKPIAPPEPEPLRLDSRAPALVETIDDEPEEVPEPPRPVAPKPQVPVATVEETLRALAPEPPAAPGRPAGRTAPAPSRGAASAGAVSRPVAAPAQRDVRCGYCGQGLPTDRSVRFCPHCGVDQTARQCAECGESLEESWRFCVACGAAADS